MKFTLGSFLWWNDRCIHLVPPVLARGIHTAVTEKLIQPIRTGEIGGTRFTMWAISTGCTLVQQQSRCRPTRPASLKRRDILQLICFAFDRQPVLYEKKKKKKIIFCNIWTRDLQLGGMTGQLTDRPNTLTWKDWRINKYIDINLPFRVSCSVAVAPLTTFVVLTGTSDINRLASMISDRTPSALTGERTPIGKNDAN